MRRLKRVEFQGTMKSRRRLGSTVAETPAKFHIDTCILTPELVPSGVCRVFRWGDSCDIELSLRVQLSNPDLSRMPQVSLLIVYGLSPFRYQAISCNSAVLVLFNPLEQGSSGWLLALLPVPGVVKMTTPVVISGRTAVTWTTLWVSMPKSLTLGCRVALDVSGSHFDFHPLQIC